MSVNDIASGERYQRGGEVPFGISGADRFRHLYLVGQTGTGKSMLLRRLIAQDLEADQGLSIVKGCRLHAVLVRTGGFSRRTRATAAAQRSCDPTRSLSESGSEGKAPTPTASPIAHGFRNIVPLILYVQMSCLAMIGRIFEGFDWDEGNWPKGGKHGLSQEEIEQEFLNTPAIRPHPAHSVIEERMKAIGKTDEGRHAYVSFTFRLPSPHLLGHFFGRFL